MSTRSRSAVPASSGRRSCAASRWASSARSCRGTCRCSSPSLKLGPALASGSTVVLKPSPETPLDAYLLAEIVQEAGLPAGVLNIVQADREVSEYLVRHPDIDKVSFTGSSVAGRKIGAHLRRAAQALHARARRQVGGDHPRRRRPRVDRRRPHAQRDHEQRRGVRRADPHPRVARPLRRRRRRGGHRGRGDEGGRPARPRDRGRPAGRVASPRPGRGLHRQGPRRRCPRRHRRRPPGRPRQGLVRRADDLRRRRQHDDHRPGGDLRSRPVGHPLRRRRRRGPHRQRLRLRPLGFGVDRRPAVAASTSPVACAPAPTA